MNLKIQVASAATLLAALLTGCTSVSAASAPATPAATSVATSATTASPSATSTPSASATADTTVFGPTIDCTGGTPEQKYLGLCQVEGKTQTQVWQACRAAAWGSLWDESMQHRYGIKNPNLDTDRATCGEGLGLMAGDSVAVFGSPDSLVDNRKGRTPDESALRYILVRGNTVSEPDGDYIFTVFNATGPKAGYPVSDEGNVLRDKILDMYAAASGGV